MTVATHAQMAAEIASNLPSGNPSVLTAASLRQVLNDFNDSTLQTLNINPSVATLNQGIAVTQQMTGTNSGNTNYNEINVSTDNATITSQGFGIGLYSQVLCGGSSMQGGREAIQGTVSLGTASGSASSNRNYVGVQGVGQAAAQDNGTGLTTTTAQGAVFGIAGLGTLLPGATNFLNATGCECNVAVQSTATVAIKTLAQFSSHTSDKVQGSLVDSMMWMYNQASTNPGWNNAILIDGTTYTWPMISTGTIIKTIGSGSCASGIDFTATNFTGNAIATPGFAVGSAGKVSANSTTATASTASQFMQIGTTAGLGLYFGNASPPTVSTAASGSLYISTTGNSTSTRLYVSNSVQSWVAVTTAS